ncbi:MAG: NUDIX domain-containing protein [bacterium]
MSVSGATVLLVDSTTHRVLLLHRQLHWKGWEYVKGGLLPGETPAETARREVKEETGLVPASLSPLSAELSFNDGSEQRTFAAFLGLVNEQPIRVGPEHDDARWVSFDEARTLLTYPDQLLPLDAAQSMIKKSL